MKFCQLHWDHLRDAISSRNLMQFVAGDGAKAVAAIKRQIAGMEEKDDWDPLINANFAIWTQALKNGGLYLMGVDENGNEYCPLCEVAKHAGEGVDQNWIDGCCDAQLEFAQESGRLKESKPS